MQAESCSAPKKTPDKAQPTSAFVKIPGGTYNLGKQGHSVNPEHQVTLKEFYISTREVTNNQWQEFIESTGYVTTAEFQKNGKTFYPGLSEFEWKNDSSANWRYPFGVSEEDIEKKGNHPVTNISFVDVQAFCEWAHVRLPTLDEWEVASRAGSSDEWFWGQDFEQMNDHANIWQNRNHQEIVVKDDYLYTSPVGQYKPNQWGLYDMYGNVFEFCADRPEKYESYPHLACSRGGSWWCARHVCNFFNSVDIGKVHKYASFPNQGFRVVIDALK